MLLEETGTGERIIVEVSFPNLLLDFYIIPEHPPPPGNLTPLQTGLSPELADRNLTLGGRSGTIPIGCVTQLLADVGHQPTAQCNGLSAKTGATPVGTGIQTQKNSACFYIPIPENNNVELQTKLKG